MSQTATAVPRDVPTASFSKPVANIVSVSGAQAVALLDRRSVGQSHASRVEIGDAVMVSTPHTIVIGLVSGVTVTMPDTETDQNMLRLIELSLAGEIVEDPIHGRPEFRRGVSCLPTLGDNVHMADRHILTLAYGQPDAATIEVGSLFQNSAVPARLLVDELFGKHFLIVGTTGCGKTSALTCILQSLLPEYKYARVVVLDIHNEYAAAFGEQAETIDPSSLHLPFWLLSFRELIAAFTSAEENAEAEIEILGDAVLWAKRRYSDAPNGRVRRSTDVQRITVDTPVPFRLADVIAYIDEQLGKLERALSTLPYKRLKYRIETLVSDPRYGFMFGSMMVEDTMVEILGRLFRVPVGTKPITVLNLSVIPGEIMDVVISVISRLAFDLASWSESQIPLLIVCEEAHRYAPADDGGKFMPTREALACIAKEGRKYGVSLALITQRPSELDQTILSQCSTVIAMRLSTECDQSVVRANTHEGSLDLLNFLPLLGDREAIVLGQGVGIPMRIRFRDARRCVSDEKRQALFSRAWKESEVSRETLREIVGRWRSPAKSAPPPRIDMSFDKVG